MLKLPLAVAPGPPGPWIGGPCAGPSGWWRSKCDRSRRHHSADPGPAESDSESGNESLSDSPIGQVEGWGNYPENSAQTDEEDDPGEFMACKKMSIVL